MKRKALVASTEDDSHIWNLIGVEYMLGDRGFEVVNLGACTCGDEIAEHIQRHRPDLVVVSSVNGHGVITGLSLAMTLQEYQAFRLSTIVIGGKLTLGPETQAEARLQLVEAGFAEVFTGDSAWQEFDRFLAARDLLALAPQRGLSASSRTSKEYDL